jgi:hypothetical protein
MYGIIWNLLNYNTLDATDEYNRRILRQGPLLLMKHHGDIVVENWINGMQFMERTTKKGKIHQQQSTSNWSQLPFIYYI